MQSAGYYLNDFDARPSGNSVKWDGVFTKGSGGSAIWRNFSRDDFNAKWKEQTARGYRLVDVETYKIGSKRYWAGIFSFETPGRVTVGSC